MLSVCGNAILPVEFLAFSSFDSICSAIIYAILIIKMCPGVPWNVHLKPFAVRKDYAHSAVNHLSVSSVLHGF